MLSDFQKSSEIIRLSDGWELWDGSPVYQQGTRSKSSVRYIGSNSPSFIRADWRYLFKLSRSRYPWQFWMEVTAYRIGCGVGGTWIFKEIKFMMSETTVHCLME
jgi:hypothetical protein